MQANGANLKMDTIKDGSFGTASAAAMAAAAAAVTTHKTSIPRSKRGGKASRPIDRPFQCPHCKYRCSRRGHLTVHVRTHTGQKPFGCTLCKYRCSDKSNLSKHIRRRHQLPSGAVEVLMKSIKSSSRKRGPKKGRAKAGARGQTNHGANPEPKPNVDGRDEPNNKIEKDSDAGSISSNSDKSMATANNSEVDVSDGSTDSTDSLTKKLRKSKASSSAEGKRKRVGSREDQQSNKKGRMGKTATTTSIPHGDRE